MNNFKVLDIHYVYLRDILSVSLGFNETKEYELWNRHVFKVEFSYQQWDPQQVTKLLHVSLVWSVKMEIVWVSTFQDYSGN